MKLKILAIFVDPILGTLVETLTEPGLIELASVRTGSAGLKVIMERVPDLVILEIALPDIDGLVLLKVLARHGCVVPNGLGEAVFATQAEIDYPVGSEQ